MNLTINQIVYNLRNLIRDAKSDDIKISNRQLEFIVNYVRARLVRQDYGKGRSLSSNIIQDLGNVELELVDSAQGEVKSDHFLLRSKFEIPKPIEADQKDLIVYIGGIDKESPVQIVSKAYFHWRKYSKFTGRESIAYYRNNRIYIKTCNKFLKNINIEGVFETPRDVYSFGKLSNERLYNPDINTYPISNYMLQALNELIISKELTTFLQLSDDNRNDASDELTPDSAKREQSR
jgi:hypothetical protein